MNKSSVSTDEDEIDEGEFRATGEVNTGSSSMAASTTD
jgi:hypothetical protein